MQTSVRVTKRAIDVGAALVGLAITFPVSIIIAAAIYLDSPGPLFFRQRRAGMLLGPDPDNPDHPFRFREFNMMKFRTMIPNAEATTGAVLAKKNDPRVTRVGRFLRKVRLDELPQFWNVLVGDMSLVGPRPERPELIVNLAHAIPFFEERMRSVKPGITGLAQISLEYTGRAPKGSAVEGFYDSLTNPFKVEGAELSEADDMRIKMLYDLSYVAGLEKFSTFILTELKIILMTPFAMFRGLGH